MVFEADLHVHTVASNHAYSTVAEIASVAALKGLKMIAVTDHGPAMPGGPHEYHFSNLVALPEMIAGVRVLKGVEANIVDIDGTLDLPAYIMEKLDMVLAGFHEGTGYPGASVEENTRALINTIHNPYVHIIVHPGNPVFPIDQEKVVTAAKKAGKAIEFNNNSFGISRSGSTLNCTRLASLAKKHKLTVAVNSDAHYCETVGETSDAINVIMNAGITLEQVINTTAEKVIDYLNRHNKRLQGISAFN
jgi:putative hydrolase